MTSDRASRWHALAAAGRAARRADGRRSARDWVVDVVLFVIAIAARRASIARRDWDEHSESRSSSTSCSGRSRSLALWWRRAHPVGVGVFAGSSSSSRRSRGGAGGCRAVQRRDPRAAARAGRRSSRSALLGGGRLPARLPEPATRTWLELVVGAAADGRRDRLGPVRPRAPRARALAARARRAAGGRAAPARRAGARGRAAADRARDARRARPPRVAARLHAGALEFRPDAPPEEIAEAAGVIRASAHAALQELREVIGVLREGRGRAPSARSRRSRDIPALVEESRAAGMQVELPDRRRGRRRARRARPHRLPDRAGGADERAQARAGGGGRRSRRPRRGTRLVVEVVSRRAVGVARRRPPPPGAGTGLIGLAERVALAGGELATAATPAATSSCARRCRGRRDPRPARRRRRARALGPADDARRAPARSRSWGRPTTAAGCSARSTSTAPTSC